MPFCRKYYIILYRPLRVELLYVRFWLRTTSNGYPPEPPRLGVFGWAREARRYPGTYLGASQPMLLSRKVKKKRRKKDQQFLKNIRFRQKSAKNGLKTKVKMYIQ